MKTKRTISNISYNTEEYFQSVIDGLVDRGVIEWCYWIKHTAEEDERKDHIHFVLQPSSSVDTSMLGKLFTELDPPNKKPLGVTSKWKYTSSMDDWILYCSHDTAYLLSKGQVRHFHYAFKDFRTTDEDAFLEDWNSINRVAYERLEVLRSAVEEGTPFALLVQNGIVPIAQRAQYEKQYLALRLLMSENKTNRKESHEDDDDIPDDFVQPVDEETEQISFDMEPEEIPF